MDVAIHHDVTHKNDVRGRQVGKGRYDAGQTVMSIHFRIRHSHGGRPAPTSFHHVVEDRCHVGVQGCPKRSEFCA